MVSSGLRSNFFFFFFLDAARVRFIRAEGPRGHEGLRHPPAPPHTALVECPSAPTVEINFLPVGQVIHERPYDQTNAWDVVCQELEQKEDRGPSAGLSVARSSGPSQGMDGGLG